ncbi:MAG: glutathione S-transferase family protein [Blastomonas sp.]
MAYTLITANRNYSSWSLRPWVLMKALGIEFEDRLVVFAEDNFDHFRSFAPNAQVPCLIDGEDTIWDSLAIVEYLAERHAGVWPEDGSARAWARCAAAEMHSGFSALRNQCTMNVGVRARLHSIDAPLARDVARISELLAQGLARFGGPWLAGVQYTAVDAFFAPVAWRIRTYGLQVDPAVYDWVARIIAHPAMQQWEAEALAEPYREIGHEEELRASASIIEDFRAQ